MPDRPLPTGDAALELVLAHLFVSVPMRLDSPRPTQYGMPPSRAVIAGVSMDVHGWVFAWLAYLPSLTETPSISVWPTVRTPISFDAVLPAAAELELLARVDTSERALARLGHHLQDMVQARLNPDVEYLHRAVAAYRAELRARRDRAAGWERGAGTP